jgi:HEPN domain-containing protein
MASLDDSEFARWRGQADRALDTALLAADGGRWEWACFLAEQAAQLAVKGLLHGLAEEAWGHDLVVLVQRAATTLGSSWPSEAADPAARLSRHFIPTRYPDAHASGEPGMHYRPADAVAAVGDARTLLAAADRAWAEVSAS